jgi:hypothetical protein
MAAMQVCLLVAVRTGVETVRLCQSRDLHELGGAAGVTRVGIEHADGAGRDHVAETVFGAIVFARGLRYPGRLGDVRKPS